MTTAVTISERAARRIGEILKTRVVVPCCGSASRAAAAPVFSTSSMSTRSGRGRPGDRARQRRGAGRPCLGAISRRSEVDFVDDLIGASLPRGQSQRYGILRLRHQLLDLRDF